MGISSWKLRASGIFSRPNLPPLFVWATCAAMLIASLAFVARYGSNVPSWDDWDMVPALTGEQPITAGWLWSQHNEHRVPLPRLLLLGLNGLTGVDFRAGMFFEVCALGALACIAILAARRISGGTRYTDAFFPLILLQWGQAPNMLWSWQVQFVLSTVLAGAVLLIIVRKDASITSTAVAGLCVVLLPLSGANGVALAPALALWLILCAVRGPGSRIVVGTLAGAAILLVGAYLIGYERVPYHPTSSSLKHTVKTAIQFLAIGMGPAAREVWPYSGGLAMLFVLAAALVLVRTGRSSRLMGLLLFLIAMGSLALGLGLGRDGFEPRYVTLAIPVWCGVYVAFALHSSRLMTAGRILLFVLVALAWWPNTQFGLAYARQLRSHLGAFERDVAAGVPGFRLIQRYDEYLHPHHDVPTDYLPMLRRAGVPPYRSLRVDPAFREIPVPFPPISTSQAIWEDGVIRSTGNAPSVVFDLPASRYVDGIRLTYSSTNRQGSLPYVSIYWKGLDQAEFTTRQFKKYSPTGDRANWERGTWKRRMNRESTMTVWICDTMKQLRLHPDFKPGVFRISELVLLVPAQN